MGKLLITGKRGAGHVLRLPEGRPDICGRAHETYRRLLVVLTNDYSMETVLSPRNETYYCRLLVVLTNEYSMETALSRRGGPGEFMRTMGGKPAIAAGWEKAYRHKTVR